MKKLFYALKTHWISIILLSTTCIQSMEIPCNKYYKEAEEYNNTTCLLTSPPNETLIEIFSHCLMEDEDQVKSLERSIKGFIKMNTICQKVNNILTCKVIGKFCKNYAFEIKNQTLQNLMVKINDTNYTIKRLHILILIYAGADANTKVHFCPLLDKAMLRDDAQLIKTLLQYHANPNAKSHGFPIFFDAKTINIAQMFIKHNVNVHETGYGENILWRITNREDYSSELMEFYLNYKVNPTTLRPFDNCCLLHELAQHPYTRLIYNVNDTLKKGELLLNAMPGMINTLNKDNQTPLDIAQRSLQTAQEFGKKEVILAFEQLIALFRNHNGLTAQELVQMGIRLPDNDTWIKYRQRLLNYDVRNEYRTMM